MPVSVSVPVPGFQRQRQKTGTASENSDSVSNQRRGSVAGLGFIVDRGVRPRRPHHKSCQLAIVVRASRPHFGYRVRSIFLQPTRDRWGGREIQNPKSKFQNQTNPPHGIPDEPNFLSFSSLAPWRPNVGTIRASALRLRHPKRVALCDVTGFEADAEPLDPLGRAPVGE